MNNEKFDRVLLTIRNDSVDERLVTQAGDRVWKSIAEASPATGADPHTLRGCADFQALIPAYLAKQLGSARGLLFEDHVHTCVACRHALEHARDGEPQRVWRLQTKRSNSPVWRWAIGASAFAAVLVVAFAFSNGLLPGQHPIRAEVQAVDGSL